MPSPSDRFLDEQQEGWRRGERVLVEQYVERHPELRDDSRFLLDLIVNEYLLRKELGESPQVAEYESRFPDFAESFRLHVALDEALASSSSDSSDVADDGANDSSEPAAYERQVWGRFETRRRYARGGLGEVHVAHDQELDRRVAFKRLRRRLARSGEGRRRLLREAHLTSRLEHPGVVPIYGLIQTADDEIGYAMRLIEGESLQDAIQRLHSAAPPDSPAPAPRPRLRELLGRFVAVCNTIAYAHRCGVLHRDIKPSNIMLGHYNETIVIDWGLAKDMGSGESNSDFKGDVDDSSGESSHEADATDTMTGSALGTPAYMSPEQAAGQWGELTPASDVYGLGATLYAILTGHAPFDGSDSKRVLDLVRRGEFPRPLKRKADIPAALDAVCRKAMSLKPKDRYADPLELAADVERWMSDEPVGAWQAPWSERARRWARRHSSFVKGGVLVSILLVATTAFFSVWQRRINIRLQASVDRSIGLHKEWFHSIVLRSSPLSHDRDKYSDDDWAYMRAQYQKLIDEHGFLEVGSTFTSAELNNLSFLSLEAGDIEGALRDAKLAVELRRTQMQGEPSASGALGMAWHRVAEARARQDSSLAHATHAYDEAIKAFRTFRTHRQVADPNTNLDKYMGYSDRLAWIRSQRGLVLRFMHAADDDDAPAEALRQSIDDARASCETWNEKTGEDEDRRGLRFYLVDSWNCWTCHWPAGFSRGDRRELVETRKELLDQIKNTRRRPGWFASQWRSQADSLAQLANEAPSDERGRLHYQSFECRARASVKVWDDATLTFVRRQSESNHDADQAIAQLEAALGAGYSDDSMRSAARDWLRRDAAAIEKSPWVATLLDRDDFRRLCERIVSAGE